MWRAALGAVEGFQAAFVNCYFLSDVTIGNSVATIDELAFEFSSITSLNLPESVTTIGAAAFNNCAQLKNITIPNSVTYIGEAAFAYCTELTSIALPDSITEIRYNTFYHCTKLTSVTLGNSITDIYSSAFELCTSLTSITIPESVTSIELLAFIGCNTLTDVIFECTEGWSRSSGTKYVSISSDKVSNSQTMAEYLTSTYLYESWYRK